MTSDFSEAVAFTYVTGILKKYNITLYNTDGSSRSAEEVLRDIVREYLKGNISLKM